MRKPLYTLLIAVCLLIVSGVNGRTQKGPSNPCKDACDAAFDACMLAGNSYHQCSGDLRRCRKGC